MEFNEATAKQIIERYNLSINTLKVWKSRNSIPDRYLKNYVGPGVSRENKLEKDRLMKIITSKKINLTTIVFFSKLEKHHIDDVIRQKTDFNDTDILFLKKTINQLRIELKVLIDKLNSSYTVSPITERLLLEVLNKKWLIETKVFDNEVSKKLSAWKAKRTQFPITEKTKIVDCLVVLYIETVI